MKNNASTESNFEKKGIKRLYFVVNANLPNERAHGIQLLQMCAAFAQNGYKTTLLLPYKFGSSDSIIKNFYNIEDTFSIRLLPILLLPQSMGKIAFLARWFSFTVSAFVYLLFCGREDDLIYVRGEMILPLSFLPKKLLLCWETHIKPGRMNLYVPAMRRIHCIVTATKVYRDELVNSFGIPEQKLIVEPDGVDLLKFNDSVSLREARNTLSLPADKKIIVYTGSDIPWKGLKILKDAIRYLPQSYLAVFVGDVKKEYEDDDRFLYTGFQNHAAIPLWLAAADYLAVTGSHSSLVSQRYTSPLKLFEYMAVKRPIVAFDIPSFREVLSDETAFFVSPDAPEKIAHTIERITNEEAHMRTQKAYENVKQYSWLLRVSRIMSHIESIKVHKSVLANN